jgi:hypothetical protein
MCSKSGLLELRDVQQERIHWNCEMCSKSGSLELRDVQQERIVGTARRQASGNRYDPGDPMSAFESGQMCSLKCVWSKSGSLEL